MTKDDNRIINAILYHKDEEALKILYKKSLPKMLRMVKKFNASKEDGEDVFQDAVITLFKFIRKKSSEENIDLNIDAFMYVICKNSLIKKNKRDQKVFYETYENLNLTSKDQLQLESLIDKERDLRLNVLINQLGERCKDLIMLVYFYQQSMQEVCDKLGFGSTDVAKSTHYKCKKKLQKHLQEDPTMLELLNNGRV